MANFTTTVNLGLGLPETTDPDPDWANILFSNFEILDQALILASGGVPTNRIDIDADLPFNTFRMGVEPPLFSSDVFPGVKAVDFVSESDFGQTNGVFVQPPGDLYFIDGNGSTILVTVGGDINIVGIGYILGLTAPAEAKYSSTAASYTWLWNTTGPQYAGMVSGPVNIYTTASGPTHAVIVKSAIGLSSPVVLGLPTVTTDLSGAEIVPWYNPGVVTTAILTIATAAGGGEWLASSINPVTALPSVKGFEACDTNGNISVVQRQQVLNFGADTVGTLVVWAGVGSPGNSSYSTSVASQVVMPFAGVLTGAQVTASSAPSGAALTINVYNITNPMGDIVLTLAAGSTTTSVSGVSFPFAAGDALVCNMQAGMGIVSDLLGVQVGVQYNQTL